MRSIAIEPQGNGLLHKNGRQRFTESNLEYLQQKIRCVLSLFLGEWYLDASLGIPYIPNTDSKTGHRAILENMIQTKLMAVKGVRKLLYFTPEYDSRSRTFSVRFGVETDTGETLEGGESWNTG
jgi:hypothetical protein